MRHLVVLAAAVLLPAAASAQSNSLFGTRGPSTGALGSTATMGGPSASGGSSFGGASGSSFGGATGGASAFGGSSLGGQTGSTFGAGIGGAAGGLGNSATGASPLASQVNGFGTLGQTVGTTGFVGRANQAGGLVGSRTAGQQTGLGNLGGAGNRLGGNRNGGNSNGNQNGNSSPPKLTVRPVQRIAFGYEAPTPAATRTAVTTRLASLSTRRPELTGVTVTVDDKGRHVLSGTVPSDSARGLAAALARLEPGVREVVDELTVDGIATP